MPNNNWETPSWLADALQAYTHIDCTLDVCATDANKKCTYYIGPHDDALQTDWHTRFDFLERKEDKDLTRNCWMNPPYARGKTYAFINRAFEMRKEGITTLALIKADTSTSWWLNMVEQPCRIIFIKGRVRFEQNGESFNPANFATAAVIISPDITETTHEYVELTELRKLARKEEAHV